LDSLADGFHFQLPIIAGAVYCIDLTPKSKLLRQSGMMDNIKGTSARLRRTFHYPDDTSGTDSPEAMDEEGKLCYALQASLMCPSGHGGS